MLKELYQKPWAYQILLEEETGRYLMDVLCGGAAMYTVRIVLRPEEVDSFRKDKTSLDWLGWQVAKDERRFEDRILRL